MPATLAAPLGKAFRTARRAMRGSTDAKLTELRRLENVRREIIAERDAHSARFRRYAEKLEGVFKASPTIENEVAWRIALNVARDNRRSSESHPALLEQIFDAEAQAVWSEFVQREKGWKHALGKLSSAKLEAAQNEFAEIEKKVSNDLAGFDNETVENDARIKRAKRRLGGATTLDAEAQDAASFRDWERLYKAFTENDNQ
jgi:hypothetical protein